MTASIKRGKLRLKFWLPVGIALRIAQAAIKNLNTKNENIKVSFCGEQRKAILKCLKEIKKFNGRMELVNVKTTDGTKVVIRL